MKRYTPLLRQVSPSLSPNRTCRFPSIRLSMHGSRHGRFSESTESVERAPEAFGSRRKPFMVFRVPSIRYPYAPMRVMRCAAFTQQPQLGHAFAPPVTVTPRFAHKSVSQIAPRRLAILLSKPAIHTRSYPIVETMKVPTRQSGVTIIVTPSCQKWIEPANDIGKRPSCRYRFQHDFDFVTQVIELTLRNEDIAHIARMPVFGGLCFSASA